MQANLNPEHQRQKKASDFDLPHAKKASNFPLRCHRAGNIGLKTASFLLLSTLVWPEVWMRSIWDASAFCTIEIKRERGIEEAVWIFLPCLGEAIQPDGTTFLRGCKNSNRQFGLLMVNLCAPLFFFSTCLQASLQSVCLWINNVTAAR